MYRLKNGLGSIGLALALAAGPLRAQEPLDLGLSDGGALKGILEKVLNSPPPWAVESPGAAGATFGLGLDSLFEHQESLNLASMRTTVTVRDSGGGGSVTEVPGDPALLNRKFDFLSELQGEGTQGSIALPILGLRIYPTFHWQALSADLRLDFLNRPEPAESTSIEGRGLFYGVGFDLVTTLCNQCGWFASAGYQVQDMPSFSADRSPRIAGLDLSRDEVRIRRQVRDTSFRIGYGGPNARVISYTGVRRRSTDLDIEDELGFRGPGPDGTSEETRLRTRTKIQGEATLAVAGLNVNFGGRFFGRAETAIGDGDRVVMVKVVYLPKIRIKISQETSQKKSEKKREKKREKKLEKELKKRARLIAVGILARLIAIEKEYLAGWHALHVVAGDGGEPSYLVQEVEALLNGTEGALRGVTGDYPELEALGDWISDEFGRARKELGLEATSRTAGFGAAGALPASFSGSRPRYVLVSANLQAQRDKVIPQRKADGFLTILWKLVVGTPKEKATKKELRTRIWFEIKPGDEFETKLRDEMHLHIYPRYNPSSGGTLGPGSFQDVWIGTYSYKLDERRWCDARNPPSSPEFCPLDLVLKDCKILECGSKKCSPVDCHARK
jgi:hypothetical protein